MEQHRFLCGPTVRIHTLDDLYENEAMIIDRIHSLPNGPLLFLAHPFQLLSDIGVQLADSVREQLVASDSELDGLSTSAYDALQHADNTDVTITLKGLFRRR